MSATRAVLRYWLGVGAVCATAYVALFIACAWIDPFGHRAIRSKLFVGMSVPEVITALGENPRHDYTRATAPSNYYVTGWSRRERPITGRVLIFFFGEPICYAWFDEAGKLEDFFVGGS
jgi:hypothetical protein